MNWSKYKDLLIIIISLASVLFAGGIAAAKLDNFEDIISAQHENVLLLEKEAKEAREHIIELQVELREMKAILKDIRDEYREDRKQQGGK